MALMANKTENSKQRDGCTSSEIVLATSSLAGTFAAAIAAFVRRCGQDWGEERSDHALGVQAPGYSRRRVIDPEPEEGEPRAKIPYWWSMIQPTAGMPTLAKSSTT